MSGISTKNLPLSQNVAEVIGNDSEGDTVRISRDALARLVGYGLAEQITNAGGMAIFPDTTAGLAATTDGDYFSVPSEDDDEYLILYRNDNGSATEVSRTASTLALQSLRMDLSGMAIFADTAAGLAATTDGDYFGVLSEDEDEYLIIYHNDSGSAMEVSSTASASAIQTMRDDIASKAPSRNPVLSGVRTDRDELGDVEGGVVDPTGAAVGFDRAGRVRSTGADFRVPAFEDRDDLTEYMPILEDDEGRVALAQRPDGIDFIPSKRLLERLSLSTGSASFLGSGRRVFNVRGGDRFLYATTQLADGYVGDIKQRRGFTTAIPVSEAPLIGVHYTGQSNAGAGPGPSGEPPIRGPLAVDHILRTDQDDHASGEARVLGEASDFVTATEPRLPDQAQAPSAMAGYGVYLLSRAAGREVPGIIVSTSWRGGQTIDKFFPGVYPDTPGSVSALYENLYVQIGNAALIADDYERTVEHNIFWAQGEGDTDYASYLTQMQDYIDTVLPTFAAVSSGGAVPHFFVMQTQTGTAAEVAEMGSGNAQLQVGRDYLGSGVTLVGPMYQGPVHDNIHFDNLGRMIFGELQALVYEWVRVKGETWHPLWPEEGAVTRSGAVITIPMELPLGTSELSWDDDWVADIPNKGFWYDDDSGSPPAINDVEIDDESVVITLASDPGAATGKRVGYGTRKLIETPRWASSRGLLYADSGVRSPFAALGHELPDTIRHYCCRFTETLS